MTVHALNAVAKNGPIERLDPLPAYETALNFVVSMLFFLVL